jgi:hypothetical protein
MASQVSICNQALGWLGANLIISLNDDNKEAALCKANYNDIRDAVLEEREWTFCVRRISLSPLVIEPVYGYTNQFLIPPDVIRILNVPDTRFGDSNDTLIGTGLGGRAEGPDQQPQLSTFRVESIEQPTATGKVLLANVDSVFLRVIWRVTNIGLYSPSFVQCLAARIAADLAIPLTQNRTLQRDMWTLYEQKLNRASAMDGIQGKMEMKRSEAITRVR